MKKILTLLLVVLIVITIGIFANAKGDGLEGEPIPIELNDPGKTGKSGYSVNRGPIVVPVKASFNSTFSQVNIQFYIYGEIMIQHTNLSNKASVNMIIDSNCGSCIIPVTNGVGLYRIDFIS
jgi:hypothetical protein